MSIKDLLSATDQRSAQEWQSTAIAYAGIVEALAENKVGLTEDEVNMILDRADKLVDKYFADDVDDASNLPGYH